MKIDFSLLQRVKSIELVKNLSFSLFFALIIALSAKIKISLPFTPVPITCQTLAVFLSALFLRGVFGPLAVSFYLLFGILGLPYFAGQTAGLSYLFGPTGGYLIGFLISTIIISRWKDVHSYVKTFLVLLLANLVIYLLGGFYLSLWTGSFKKAIYLGMLPFIPGDLIKIFIALFLYKSFYKINKKILSIVVLFFLVFSIKSSFVLAGISVEGGIGAWQQKPEGWVKYKTKLSATEVDLKEDLKFSKKTKPLGWVQIEHSILLLPNLRVQYTPMKFSGSGKVTTSFTFGDITVNTNNLIKSELKLDQWDITLYKNLSIFKIGSTLRLIDFFAKVEDLTSGSKESKSATIPIPMLFLGAKISPHPFISVEAFGNWIGYSNNAYYDIVGKLDFQPPMIKNLFIGIGYRYQRIKIDEVKGLSSDIKFKGFFANLGLRF